jgi:hypothetical protein
MGTLKHQLEAVKVFEGLPTTFSVGPVEQFQAISVGNGTQNCRGYPKTVLTFDAIAANRCESGIIKFLPDYA